MKRIFLGSIGSIIKSEKGDKKAQTVQPDSILGKPIGKWFAKDEGTKEGRWITVQGHPVLIKDDDDVPTIDEETRDILRRYDKPTKDISKKRLKDPKIGSSFQTFHDKSERMGYNSEHTDSYKTKDPSTGKQINVLTISYQKAGEKTLQVDYHPGSDRIIETRRIDSPKEDKKFRTRGYVPRDSKGRGYGTDYGY